MKIEGKKDIALERLRGRVAVDAVMVPRINAAMGPKFALYQAKALEAMAGYDTFGDPAEILEKYAASTARLVFLENERQATQARVDAAATSAEIDAIISAL